MSLESGFNGIRRVPPPVNEPVRSYAPGSPEKAELKARLKAMAAERIDIPLVIGGKEVRTGDTGPGGRCRTTTRHVLADWHKARRGARAAGDRTPRPRRSREWSSWPLGGPGGRLLKAAELLATTVARRR